MAGALATLKKIAIGGTFGRNVVSKPAEPSNVGNDPNLLPSLDAMLAMARQAGGGMNGYAIFQTEGIERNRAMIYNELQIMSLDPLIHTCLSALVTSALGGDAEEGKAVFIEYKEPASQKKSDASKAKIDPKQEAKMQAEREIKQQRVLEIAADLEPMFNSIAFTVGMNAATFGDSYTRPYFKEGAGILSIDVGELLTAPMVEPFERAGLTEAYLVHGDKYMSDVIQLSHMQMARAKMPRSSFMPQVGLISKLSHGNLERDDPLDHELIPSLVGGSLLAFCEKPYRKLEFLLRLMMTQDVKNSIEENLVLLKTKGMDRKQVKTAIDNLTKIFETGWAALKNVFDKGDIPKGNITHIMPVKETDDIQFPETPSIGNNSKNEISMERVFFYARQVAGSLGLDLSIAGFADQMSGGLGEGGFFRVSVQQAHQSQAIRQAITDCFNHNVRLHYFYKYGEDIPPSEQFWAIRYWSNISALAAEQQDTELAQMQSASTMIGACEQMKGLGWSENTMKMVLVVKFNATEQMAAAIAKDMANAPKDDGGGGGFGG